jgi:diguanylate cyclase (GGDEF)-like protein
VFSSSILSQNKQAQEKLNHLAYHDALTDSPNPSAFQRSSQAGDRDVAPQRSMQAVLLLNLDRFKTINDSLGYTGGRSAVAVRLRNESPSCVREATRWRFGGDEVCDSADTHSRAQDAANAARAVKEHSTGVPVRRSGRLYRSSIGIAGLPARRTRHRPAF